MVDEMNKKLLEVLLDRRHLFMVLIPKSKSIGDLRAEVQNVACEMFTEFRGEVSTLETKKGARLPFKYEVGELLERESGILAYSSDYKMSTNGKRKHSSSRGSEEQLSKAKRKRTIASFTANGHVRQRKNTYNSVGTFTDKCVEDDNSGLEENDGIELSVNALSVELSGDGEEQSELLESERDSVNRNNDMEVDEIKRKLCFSEYSGVQNTKTRSSSTAKHISRKKTITILREDEKGDTLYGENCESAESSGSLTNLSNNKDTDECNREGNLQHRSSYLAHRKHSEHHGSNHSNKQTGLPNYARRTSETCPTPRKQAAKRIVSGYDNDDNDNCADDLTEDADSDADSNNSKQTTTANSFREHIGQTKQKATLKTRPGDVDGNLSIKQSIGALQEKEVCEMICFPETPSPLRSIGVNRSSEKRLSTSSLGSVTQTCQVKINKLPVCSEGKKLKFMWDSTTVNPTPPHEHNGSSVANEDYGDQKVDKGRKSNPVSRERPLISPNKNTDSKNEDCQEESRRIDYVAEVDHEGPTSTPTKQLRSGVKTKGKETRKAKDLEALAVQSRDDQQGGYSSDGKTRKDKTQATNTSSKHKHSPSASLHEASCDNIETRGQSRIAERSTQTHFRLKKILNCQKKVKMKR